MSSQESNKNNNSFATNPSSPPVLTEIMKECEQGHQKDIQEARNQGNFSPDTLSSILNNRSDEFLQKMGRPMTYSEMRAMFG